MPSRPLMLATALLAAAVLSGCRTLSKTSSEAERRARAEEIARQHIIVDTHIDVPYRLREVEEDITDATEGGDFDYVRAVEGGLNAPFMSIYIPSAYQKTGGALALADTLIDMVRGFAAQAPDRFAVATSPAEVRRHFREGLISLPLGLENGAPIGDDLTRLRYLHDRGIRYITLTHAEDNQISDSSYDTTRTWNGLSPFGKEVVREMNRLGIMVDVSHVTDSAFYDVMAVTEAPVIASHSSARTFTPGFERNMSDRMIRRLAENGGLIMINFGSSFLRGPYQAEGNRVRAQITDELARRGLAPSSPEGLAYFREQRRQNPVGTLQDVADHIDHVVGLVGVDHVGLGSDFDGVFALPEGLQDVADYPNLIAELLKRGYTEEDIAKILGENLLRVWSVVERAAQR